MSGPSHGSPVGDSLWNENDQSSTPAALRDEARRLEQLVLVRVALGEDPRGQGVRGEDDVRVGAADACRRAARRSPGSSCQLSTKRELRAAGERRARAGRGSPRSRARE